MDRQPLRAPGPSAGRRVLLTRAAPAVLSMSCLSTSWLIGGAPPAQAHTSLVEMTPPGGAVLAVVPSDVTLTFDEPVQDDFATVAVTDAAGTRVDAGAPAVDGATVRQPLQALTAPGRYTVSFRVVADDGHPVVDTAAFVVDGTAFASAGSTPGGVPSPIAGDAAAAAPATPAPADGRPDRGVMAALAGAGVAALAGAGAVVRRRRPSA